MCIRCLSLTPSEGIGGIKAMQFALEDAGVKPEILASINALGTSTPLNDPSRPT